MATDVLTVSATDDRGALKPAPLTPAADRAFALSLGVLWVAIMGLYFLPVPSWSEHLYLMGPLRLTEPGLLQNDWGMSGDERTHMVYTWLAAGLIKGFGLGAAGWIGRGFVTLATLWGLLAIGRKIGVRPALAAFAVFLWVATGQSLFGGEWAMRTFEAKTASYGALVWMLVALLSRRYLAAGFLIGLTFSLHPSVGLTAGIGTACMLAVLRPRGRDLPIMAGAALLIALPGLLGILPAFLSSRAQNPEDMQVLVWAFGQHFTPLTFGASRLPLAALLAAICAAWMVRPGTGQDTRAVIAFVLGTGLLTLTGLLAWGAGSFALVPYFPFRVFPLLLPLLFMMLLVSEPMLRASGRWRVPLAIGAVVALTSLQDPIAGVAELLRESRGEWRPTGADDYALALDWARRETPIDAILAVPPSRERAYTQGRRAVIALLAVPRYDQLQEWHARLEALMGPITSAEDLSKGMQRYEALNEGAARELGSRYGATFMLTRTDYPGLQLRAREGSVNIYALPGGSLGPTAPASR